MSHFRRGWAIRRPKAAAALGVLFVVGVIAVAFVGEASATKVPVAKAAAAKTPVTLSLIAYDDPGLNLLSPMTIGADAAIKVIDSEGGFGGRKVKLVTCNSMLTTAAAEECAQKTVGDHPVAMLGCELEWAAGGGLRIYSAAKIPSVNCEDSQVDFTSNWEFGPVAGGTGDVGAAASYACTLKSVKTVDVMVFDLPSDTSYFTDGLQPILKACGKKAVLSAIPTTAVDMSPYIAQAMESKPQFVISAEETAQTEAIYSGFEADGIPASHIAASGIYFIPQVLNATPAMKGGLAIEEWAPYTDTNDAGVSQYVKAVKSPTNYKNTDVEWGYGLVMWVYTAAEHIGFSKFNNVTFTNYMRTAKDVEMPLSLDWNNPGPKAAPSIKQPYDQLDVWTGSTFKPVSGGNDGWFNGWPKQAG